MLGRNLRWTGIVLFILTAAAPAARADLLHDNGPLVNSPGTGAGGADECALQTALGMNTIGYTHSAANGSRVADDFTVTDPSGWFLDQITFYAYQTGAGTSPSTITNSTSCSSQRTTSTRSRPSRRGPSTTC